MTCQLTHPVPLRELFVVKKDNQNEVDKVFKLPSTRVALGKILTIILNEIKYKTWNSKTHLTFLRTYLDTTAKRRNKN